MDADFKKKSRRSGSILILVLIVVSGMTIIVFGLAYQSSIDIRLSGSSAQDVRLWYLAMSGIEAAAAHLSERELTPERTVELCRSYGVEESLQYFEQLGLAAEDFELAYWIMDENSLLDLNKSNPVLWEHLPGFTRSRISCILDWIGSGTGPWPEGAQSDYYERLEPPYTCKHAPAITLRELLFIKDITRDDYFGQLPADGLSAAHVDTHLRQQDFLAGQFTVHGQPRVNINTVSPQTLSVFPGLDAETVDIITAFRAGSDPRNNVVFEDAECIAQLDRLTPLERELLEEYVIYNSDMFRVFSFARINEQHCLLMATINIAQNEPRIIYIERLL